MKTALLSLHSCIILYIYVSCEIYYDFKDIFKVAQIVKNELIIVSTGDRFPTRKLVKNKNI